ncbi:MAG: hypothetical protein AAFX78_03510 [Cyanobacteria bacterium J06638_20]
MTPIHLIERLQKLPVDAQIEEMGTVSQIMDAEWEPLCIVIDSAETLEAALVKLRAFVKRTGIPPEQICPLWYARKLSICDGMFLTLPELADESWAQIAAHG